MEINRKFVDKRFDFVEFPNVPYWKMSTRTKQFVMDGLRQITYHERARRYLKLTGDADVMHFQQILNAFGSLALFKWLSFRSDAARVVTVHELDPYQQAHPEVSAGYAKADGIIVHTEEMRDKLVSLGADRERIDVLCHGVNVRPVVEGPRSGIMFWGGHKLNSSKGLATLFTALSILKQKLGSATPKLTIHGHYGSQTPEDATQSAREAGVANDVRWLNEISFDDAVGEYQSALLCVLPFTGSFAGYPATLAMASATPVIGTRQAGLPEHLGDTGIWVRENDPSDLASAILRLLEDDGERRRIGDEARARAERELSWEAIARKTVSSYERATRFKRTRASLAS
jgi:glycosyltransferase involved in cell wall biosynthesis